MAFRIGHSHDTHRLEVGRDLVLGGVKIDYHKGLVGHSDADLVFHTVSEAIIGALAMGDLGTHFSDKDPKYKNISSSYFVVEAKKMLDEAGYVIANLDLTIYIEEPMMKPYTLIMKENLRKLLQLELNQINIKATRGEGLGFIGSGEGASAECVILIEKTATLKKLNNLI